VARGKPFKDKGALGVRNHGFKMKGLVGRGKAAESGARRHDADLHSLKFLEDFSYLQIH